MPLSEKSQTDQPAIKAENESSGSAIWANAKKGTASVGISIDGVGVRGDSTNGQGVWGNSHAKFHAGVTGVNDNTTNEAGPGVFGTGKGTGVWGKSTTWNGVFGETESTTGGAGVCGVNEKGNGVGVIGKSKKSVGVRGDSVEGQGVWGESIQGSGVVGISKKWIAVYGKSEQQHAVMGESIKGAGVVGISEQYEGVYAESKGAAAGIHAKSKGGVAGFFEGDVEVTGDIRLKNADFAEDFDITPAVEVDPGTVMVLSQEGWLEACCCAYDKKVAGVISGAGSFKPGIIMDKQISKNKRMPVALLGKVYCKVDADIAPIEIGDLLTTSDTLGYAMKAADPFRAFGTVIGKALQPLNEGQGLIPILISLQ